MSPLSVSGESIPIPAQVTEAGREVEARFQVLCDATEITVSNRLPPRHVFDRQVRTTVIRGVITHDLLKLLLCELSRRDENLPSATLTGIVVRTSVTS